MSDCERETCKFWTEEAGCFWLACEEPDAALRAASPADVRDDVVE